MPPTDRPRERTLARLRDGYACGDLGTATFDRRIDAALRASTREELRGLTVDLPVAEPAWRRAGSVVEKWLRNDTATGGLLAAVELGSGRLTLGRSPRCELVLDDDTVSRRHATLQLQDGRWYLVDLDSSNGTWVNGRRTFNAEVRPGDEIRLGAVRLRL